MAKKMCTDNELRVLYFIFIDKFTQKEETSLAEKNDYIFFYMRLIVVTVTPDTHFIISMYCLLKCNSYLLIAGGAVSPKTGVPLRASSDDLSCDTFSCDVFSAVTV